MSGYQLKGHLSWCHDRLVFGHGHSCSDRPRNVSFELAIFAPNSYGMKKLFTPFFTLLAAAVAAQPTLTSADMTPSMGPQPAVHSVPYIAPGPASANFTFNTGPITVGTDGAVATYMLPSATPYPTMFPLATHASTALTNPLLYSFQQINSTGLSLVGLAGPAYTTTYSNPDRFLATPLSYNNTWSDPWLANFNYSGTITTRSGTTNGHYNGYGTIVLPWGSFNVMRIEIDQEFSDSMDGLVFAEGSINTVTYYMPGMDASLFTSSAVDVNGQITYTTSVLDPQAVGIFDTTSGGLTFTMFPNPASEAVTVRVGDVSQAIHIEVRDMLGRQVAEQLVSAFGYTQDHELDIRGLAPGRYQVVLRTADGVLGSAPLVRL